MRTMPLLIATNVEWMTTIAGMNASGLTMTKRNGLQTATTVHGLMMNAGRNASSTTEIPRESGSIALFTNLEFVLRDSFFNPS